MRNSLYSVSTWIKVAACAVMALGFSSQAPAQEKKANPAGDWSWSRPGRDGGADRKTTLQLKMEGDKLMGKLIAPGRQGGDPRETAIENVKWDGTELSFTVTRTGGNNQFSQKYMGKIDGDTLTGKIEFDRNGETRSRDWEAKREASKKE